MNKIHDALIQKLVDEGKILEAGWVALKLCGISPSAGEVQLREMRMAYMVGAQHLFSSIMNILEPGAEPTEKDLERMNLIHREIEAYAKELKAQMPASPVGSRN